MGRGGFRAGAGRKSKAAEDENYQALKELFFKPINLKKMERKIATGKYSGKDMMKLKVAQGEMNALLKVFQKVIPDAIVADINSRSEFDGIRLDK